MSLPPAFEERNAAQQIIGAEAYLGEPQAGLVFVTTIVGAILGALGGAYRARREGALAA